MSPRPPRLAVVGGGWAGLAAAVDGLRRGWSVQLYEMAPQVGGRARSLAGEPRLDNGQHIMIGAYRDCLQLMQEVGVDPEQALLRQPLNLRYPDGAGLTLPPGPALPAFVRGVLAQRHWPWSARFTLLLHCTRWMLRGFRCAPELSVAQLCASLPGVVQRELIEPLCVAALNTEARQASAEVFLRVLHDALFQGPGASDLLLPRRPLAELLPEPAESWLLAHGASLTLGHRVAALTPNGEGQWHVDGACFDAVILACPAPEAARLVGRLAPDWAAQSAALRYEPIVTVYLESPGSRLPAAMMALREGPAAPAQFAFDLGQLGHAPGRFAFVVSGAARWVEQGLDACAEATLRQAQQALSWNSPPRLLRCLAEKRATFACTPGLQRPPAQIAPGLWAAGDYIAGPYPATLEGAVRSAHAAVAGLAMQMVE